jgi:photosystem I P700 chlorophyll a apoprotein A1
MHFHGAYFSNYGAWLKDAKHCPPAISGASYGDPPHFQASALSAYYFQGTRILSGLFQVWRAEGILSSGHLKCAAAVSGALSIIILVGGSFFHMHVSRAEGRLPGTSSLELQKWKALSTHHFSLLAGLGSIAFAGHQHHISAPLNLLLHSGVSKDVFGPAEALFAKDLMEAIFPGGNYFASGGPKALLIPAAHHFYVGVVFILGGIIKGFFHSGASLENTSFHRALATNLGILGSLSAAFAFLVSQGTALSSYPLLLSDYPTLVCLFCHHMWVAGFLMVGSGAHFSIFCVSSGVGASYQGLPTFGGILKHRDVIMCHLIWVTLFLGMHSFGLYIHNDTLQALGNPQDTFGDNSIQLKPIYAIAAVAGSVGSIEVLDGKLALVASAGEMGGSLLPAQEPRPSSWGTADFMLHHVHAFTIHLSLLILLKGILYARSSRLVSDKLELGFRYPCDGPGRGGTCQISPWDHIYLALFWMYNSIAVLLFGYFWKVQSDGPIMREVLATTGGGDSLQALKGGLACGDFSVNSTSVNGWLRNFLWSQAAQVIQAYGTHLASYGLIFIGAHFVWAFSLMFLYSGRGYWQELIESVLWAHHKLKIVPRIQPRALSISMGRAVGLAHYLLGGIGCIWAFFISRMLG